MRTIISVLAVVFLISITASISEPRETGAIKDRPVRDVPDAVYRELLDEGMRPRYSSAPVDTYLIVSYDFEPLNWQGWTRFDHTAQRDTFFHADDFDGLGGGDFGRLVPLEGTKSIWCGSRPGDEPFDYFCQWETLPGYGNSWDQSLATGEIAFNGVLNLSYHGVFDSQPEWDYTHIEYDAGEGEWVRLHSWDGVRDTVVTHEIRITKNRTKLRFHFVSDGAWSDHEGLYNSDGGCIIDEITISDESGTIDYEDFEDWEVGEHSHYSMWRAETPMAFGLYSGLALGLEDKDPCGDNFGTQIVFFVGSTVPSDDYPGLYVTPFCKGSEVGEGPCQDESVISPIIDMAKYSTGRDEIQDADIPAEDLPWLGGAKLRFTVYRDLPLANIVFYTWKVRSLDPVTLCPRQWVKYHFCLYGPEGKYIFTENHIGRLVGQEPVQIMFKAFDMCEAWYDSYGDCAAHTPSPWFDNIELLRYSERGPQWAYRDLDIFQDNFPEDEFDLESWVRADAANDLNANDNPIIHPGDSIVFDCTSPIAGSLRNGGITGGAEVYCHVRAIDIGGLGKPALFGPLLAGNYGTYDSDDGEWTIIQCDSALAGGDHVIEDKYMVDLNDSLFTRGYMVEYYFEAFDINNDRSTLPKFADQGQFFEFTCLPTGKSDILFVDDFHGRGTFEGVTELYYNWTFNAVIPSEDWPDRYDVNGPSSLVSNGPGSRAHLNHLMRNEGERYGYRIIVWDSGDLRSGTITDGSTLSDKSEDCAMLIDWLDQSENDVGLWVAGDDVAYDLHGLPLGQALELMSTWCGVDFIEASYFDLTGGRFAGGVVNPLITGDAAGIFGNELELYAFGGCPLINSFDVLDATANGAVALWYPEYGGDQYAAGIQSVTTNSAGYNAKTLWLGFSFMSVRDASTPAPLVRNILMADFMSWIGHELKDPWDIGPMEEEIPNAYRLSQNFPNPFNPTTTIRFDIKMKGHVRLRIYNVAGQLVKTLVDDVMDAGSYTKEWTGVNNAGVKVASGVYFYRIEAVGYENVKKMVLLR